MSTPDRRFVPALRFGWATRFYDGAMHVLFDEEALRGRLVVAAEVREGHRVLDLGCGTAATALAIKRHCPLATVVGLDPDPTALNIARRKARASGLDIELVQGTAAGLLAAGSDRFDRVVSSLVLHHLAPPEKRATLSAARQLLRPGGELHVLDWARPRGALRRGGFFLVRLLDGLVNTADNAHGRLPDFFREAGFIAVAETATVDTWLGTLGFYRAESPDSARRDSAPRAP